MDNPVLAMASSVPGATRDLRLAVRRGALLRCPNCGVGHLFRSYLKPVDECAHCGEALGYIRADDGPTWLTLLIVGHLVVALALVVVSTTDWSTGFSMMFFSALAVVLSLALLPSAKGIFIGIIWAQKLTKPDGA